MEKRAPAGAAHIGETMHYNGSPDAYSGISGGASRVVTELRYPRSIKKFKRERGLHPNQKPVALCDYFIRTYTDAGHAVLDCYMGSATTGAACMGLGRRFLGIEKEPKYFDIACHRLSTIATAKVSRGATGDLFASAR